MTTLFLTTEAEESKHQYKSGPNIYRSLIFCVKRKPVKFSSIVQSNKAQAEKESEASSEKTSTSGETNNAGHQIIPESVKNEKRRIVHKQSTDPRSNGLRIIDLTKSYKKISPNPAKNVYALNHLYMGIESGELLGLLGPNGAGRS